MPKNDVNLRIGATDKTATAFKSAEGRMKSLAGSAKSLAGGLAAVLGTRAIIGMVNGAVQYGSALTDAATATQTNIEALQVFRAAARDAGAEQSKMENAMVRVHKAGVDASNGLSTYTRAFEALNINVDEYNKMPTEKKLEMIATGMSNAKDQNAAYAAAMDIMGTRNAPKLMEVLHRLGKDGYESLAEDIGKTNKIMSETDAQTLDAAADAMARMKTNITLVTAEAIAPWLELFAAFSEGGFALDNMSEAATSLLNKLNAVGLALNQAGIYASDPLGGKDRDKRLQDAGARWGAGEADMNSVSDKVLSRHLEKQAALANGAEPASFGVWDSAGEYVKVSKAFYNAIKADMETKKMTAEAIRAADAKARQALSQVLIARS